MPPIASVAVSGGGALVSEYYCIAQNSIETDIRKKCDKYCRISEKICSTFKEMVIAQYITSALSISVCIYQISTEKESQMQLLIYCIYLCCMMTQLFIYCYFGNEVTIQSQSLRTSIFHIDWSLLSLEVKKELLIIFIRTSVPIEMFKGVFMTLTLESFINILKVSYTAFNVLRDSA
ncbi:PREDICTED: putative odorant receptor 92a [Ceratosolen solmsi marchali]|uniref:Odorant receptor 92a n=1 Tax=Ceratosolen solmsi marchali TaxID=326594 RepID=A0AAJ6YWG1_9HYME|nr:PREDICTED: putative odorant receptor 92a [Ceratosolen solmsi marchali]